MVPSTAPVPSALLVLVFSALFIPSVVRVSSTIPSAVLALRGVLVHSIELELGTV